VTVAPDDLVSDEQPAGKRDRIASRRRRASNDRRKQYYVIDYFVIVDYAIYDR